MLSVRICHTPLCCVVSASCVRRNVDIFFIPAVACDEMGDTTAVIASVVGLTCIIIIVSIVYVTILAILARKLNRKLQWSNVGRVDITTQVRFDCI